MKKKKSDSRELVFDFDTPMPTRQKPAVSADSVGFESKIRDAEQYAWGRSASPKRVNMLTPDEVMGRRSAPIERAPAVKESVVEKPIEKRTAEPIENIPMTNSRDKSDAEGGLSSAARMVLHLMRDKEEEELVDIKLADLSKHADDTEHKQIITENVELVAKAVERRVVPEFSDSEPEDKPAVKLEEAEPVKETVAEKTLMFDFDDKPIAAPAEPSETENKAEDDFNKARRAFVESFELDSERLAAEPAVAPIEAETVAESIEKTAVFAGPAAVAEQSESQEATRQIDFDVDFDFLRETDAADAAENEIETIEDYRSIDDADAIYTDFQIRKRRLNLRCGITATIAALLLVMTLVGGVIPFGEPVFFIVMAVLLGIGALVNISLFTSLVSLFKGRCDTDFAPMFALVASLVQTVTVGLVGSDSLTATSMLAAVAMMSVAFNCFGKRYTVKRILLNFEVVGTEETKNAVQLIGSPKSATFADPARVGESLVCGRHRAIDLKNFIGYSLSADPYEKLTFKLMIISLAACAVAAGVAVFANKGGAADAVSAVATVATVCAPFSAFISVGRNLFRVCTKLRNEGAMLTGYKAAEDISEANVVAFSADELFYDECVSLYNFKTFQDFPIDTAIITAAALTRAGNSPLAGMFNQIVSTNSGKLPLVDTVIYEQKMGLTGWVNDRKTLLGNRMILESHNIATPPLSLDKKIVSAGKFPVYLAVDDKLVAIFIVGYTAKRSLLHRIRRLINTGVTLLIDTVDPNVTDTLISDAYGIPRDAVVVMSADSARRYREQYSPSESEQARMTATSNEGYIDGYLAAYNLRNSASFSSVVTTVMVCLGIVLSIVMPIVGLGGFVNAVSVLVLHCVNYLLLFVANLFYRF